MSDVRQNVCIVTFPVNKAGYTPLLNIVDILYHLCDSSHIITGNIDSKLFCDYPKIKIYDVEHKSYKSTIRRILSYVYTQLMISYRILKIAHSVDVWIIFLGENLIVPQLTMKILRKDIIFVSTSFSIETNRVRKDLFFDVIKIMTKSNWILSDKIVLYSPRLISEWGLEKYTKKIYIANEHHLDFDIFCIKKKLKDRKYVGFIGRLSETKGALNFVKSIYSTFIREEDLSFLMIGDGQLKDEIQLYVSENKLDVKIKFISWIPHDKIPEYLNELRLIVIPSHSEGLPNIMLEAMACGTPVLSTSVGAIPDFIIDYETGFIMKNNSPECIAMNIKRALIYSNEEIVKNARSVVENKLAYEDIVERWKKILGHK